MACNSISGISYSCLSNTGGVKAIYITNFENVTGTTANGIGTLTAIDMAGSSLFQEFKFQRDTSSLEEDAMINIQNGSTYYTQTVSLDIPKRDAAKGAAISVLTQGQPLLSLIVEDFNGSYWFIGKDNGAYLTQNKSGSGTKKADGSNYKLQFIAEEQNMAPEIDASVISTIVA